MGGPGAYKALMARPLTIKSNFNFFHFFSDLWSVSQCGFFELWHKILLQLFKIYRKLNYLLFRFWNNRLTFTTRLLTFISDMYGHRIKVSCKKCYSGISSDPDPVGQKGFRSGCSALTLSWSKVWGELDGRSLAQPNQPQTQTDASTKYKWNFVCKHVECSNYNILLIYVI